MQGIQGPQGEQGIQGIQGPSGTDGTDGYNPTVTTSKSGKTTTITITDVNGDHTATILDGADGASSWGEITGTLSNQTDLQTALNGKEISTNKVTSLSSSSTDTQYPSAKCVYDLVGDVETLLTTLDVGNGV